MPKSENLHVSRYAEPVGGYVATVVPASRDWILYVAASGAPDLYIATTPATDGDTDREYVPCPRP